MANKLCNGISVVICCYNSAARLPKTLQHLAQQQFLNSPDWEVIVVNNLSTDDTAEVARREWEIYALIQPLRIINADEPGLSFARETGIAAAQYDIILFCDDDNWLSPNYVQEAYAILQQKNIAATGGFNEGVFEIEPPHWIQSFQGSYAIGKQGTGDFEILPKGRYITGAGMAFKKDIYQEIKEKGFRFFLTDRLGNQVIGGGDVELCYLFQLNGYDIAYSSRLILQHYMPAGRITKKYLTNMWQAYPQSWLVFEAYKALLMPVKQGDTELSSYWKKLATRRLKKTAANVVSYIKAKMKGQISYILPYETHWRYNLFLYQHSHKLISIITELKNKSKK